MFDDEKSWLIFLFMLYICKLPDDKMTMIGSDAADKQTINTTIRATYRAYINVVVNK